MEAAAQSSIFGNDFATASLFLWLKVFPIPPQICLFQIQILIVGFFQDLFFVGKFQKVVGFVKFVIAGIDEVFFALRLAVIAVRHHQIPVHGLFDGILRGVEGVLAFANVLDDGGESFSYRRIEVLNHVWDDRLYWWPVPQSEMSKSGALIQNPGY